MSAVTPIHDLNEMVAKLDPHLYDGTYVFASIPAGHVPDFPVVATFREQEGMSIILSEADAVRNGVDILFRAAWITLRVPSALSGVGLTAAVSAALTKAGIACNIIAAAVHDHLFVPVENADEVLEILVKLQSDAGGG